MDVPRVLVALDCSATWSRGALRGFARVADEQGWMVEYCHHVADLEAIAKAISPRVAVLGGMSSGLWPAKSYECVSVAINSARCGECIASVCLDEASTVALALSHLLARGFRTLTTFSFGVWAAER